MGVKCDLLIMLEITHISPENIISDEKWKVLKVILECSNQT
jgi:hypothetical protein